MPQIILFTFFIKQFKLLKFYTAWLYSYHFIFRKVFILKLNKNLEEKNSYPRITAPFFCFFSKLHLSTVILQYPALWYIWYSKRPAYKVSPREFDPETGHSLTHYKCVFWPPEGRKALPSCWKALLGPNHRSGLGTLPLHKFRALGL